MDDKLFQEFHCGESGGGCNGYIHMRLNMNYDRVIKIVCPNCLHEHQRYIKGGRIVEDGRYSNGDPKENLCPPKSAYSKKPITKHLDKHKVSRDAIPIKSDADLVRDNFMQERWLEIGGKSGG